jgi:hypothetical protein
MPSPFVFLWAFGLVEALLYINALFTLCNVLNYQLTVSKASQVIQKMCYCRGLLFCNQELH